MSYKSLPCIGFPTQVLTSCTLHINITNQSYQLSTGVWYKDKWLSLFLCAVVVCLHKKCLKSYLAALCHFILKAEITSGEEKWVKLLSTSRQATEATTNQSQRRRWLTYKSVASTLESYLGNRTLRWQWLIFSEKAVSDFLTCPFMGTSLVLHFILKLWVSYTLILRISFFICWIFYCFPSSRLWCHELNNTVKLYFVDLAFCGFFGIVKLSLTLFSLSLCVRTCACVCEVPVLLGSFYCLMSLTERWKIIIQRFTARLGYSSDVRERHCTERILNPPTANMMVERPKGKVSKPLSDL